jgi:hypothetical protein
MASRAEWGYGGVGGDAGCQRLRDAKNAERREGAHHITVLSALPASERFSGWPGAER